MSYICFCDKCGQPTGPAPYEATFGVVGGLNSGAKHGVQRTKYLCVVCHDLLAAWFSAESKAKGNKEPVLSTLRSPWPPQEEETL